VLRFHPLHVSLADRSVPLRLSSDRRRIPKAQSVRKVSCFVVCLSLASCSGDTRFLEPENGNGDGGGDLRADLIVMVPIAEGDAAIAPVLGWSSAMIEGAAVTVRRTGQSETTTLETGPDGQVVFEQLLVGNYVIAVRRLLTSEEEGRLRDDGGGFRDVDLFGGGRVASLSAPSRSVTVDAAAGRRGSLVFSELSNASGRSETENYPWAQYLEFYNNADTIVFMDGMILGRGIWTLHDHVDLDCATLEPWRTDAGGIWSKMHVQFPGSGTQYPVLPGETVVLAADAIDHSEFWEGMPDLSNADFESVGSSDVDNPSVPNVIDVGIQRWDSPAGRGIVVRPAIHFLAEALDVEQLETEELPDRESNPLHRRFPASAIVDVAVLLVPHSLIPTLPGSAGKYCDPVISPAFDRAAFHDFLAEPGQLSAARRRFLTTLEDGRVVLQRTRTSGVDFQMGPLAPGRVPTAP
jgi:hypothetical protein